MILKIYLLISEFLVNRGLGKFRFIVDLHQYFLRMLTPKENFLVPINEKNKIFLHGSRYSGTLSGLGGLLSSGIYEKYQTILFKKIVKRGMNVVDIGANIGYYTLLAAEFTGDQGKVFAFEPEPENYSLLLKNIHINGYRNIIALQKAVSNKTEKKKLIISNKDFGGHSFWNPDKARESIMVNVISLDDFFKKQRIPIDIIKMDIEGAEMLGLLGMKKIIEANDNLKIFTEFYPKLLRYSGFTPKKYYDKLRKCGFKFIYLIDEQKQRLEYIDFIHMMKFFEKSKLYPLVRKPLVVNLLCTKSSFKE